MPRVNPAAEVFGDVADSYERGRPGYPEEAVRFALIEARIDREAPVLEVGAGSGKLTRRLAERVTAVTAVEPVAGMRALLASSLPAVTVVDGTAESLPLPDGAFAAVFAAQAFHWFDTAEALAEFHRVLRPAGALVLLWNVRDEAAPVNRAVSEIIEPLKGSTPRYASIDWAVTLSASSLFDNVSELRVPHVQRLTRDDFTARFMSVSWIASLPVPIRDAIRHDLQQVHLRHSHDGTAMVPYTTSVYVAARI